METATMGRVLTEAMIENFQDLYAVKLGVLRPIRSAGSWFAMPWSTPGRRSSRCRRG